LISFSNKIENIDDLVSAAILASLLEVSATPKPGNVHRNRDIEKENNIITSYEHFLCANTIISGDLRRIALGKESMTKNLINAVHKTKKWQTGGNINFGILLLYLPLLSAAGKMIINGKDVSDIDELMVEVADVIENSTQMDSIKLYQAIGIVNPGGMGVVGELDVHDEASIQKIKEKKLNLKDIFRASASRDNIASEWVTNFKICRETGLPYFMEQALATQNLNYSIILTFLRILSKYPDTLIIRKSNKTMGKKISEKAKELLEISNKETQLEEIKKFDDYLHGFKGQYNPGTTADLVAATLFLSLLKGLHF